LFGELALPLGDFTIYFRRINRTTLYGNNYKKKPIRGLLAVDICIHFAYNARVYVHLWPFGPFFHPMRKE